VRRMSRQQLYVLHCMGSADVAVQWSDALLSCGCAVQLVTTSSLAVCDQYGAIMEVRSGW
jgi:hypothetical protein